MRSLPAEEARTFEPLMNFVYDRRSLLKEADPGACQRAIVEITERFIQEGATHDLFQVLDGSQREAVLGDVESALAVAADAPKQGIAAVGSVLRHVFDGLASLALGVLEARCLEGFINSLFYDYVLELKMKESEQIGLEHVRIERLLGEGGFGQVLEVVKRDCGKRYAMKVMEKAQLQDAYGEDVWEELALMERTVMCALHHPLLINLNYAFQNAGFLFFLTDGKRRCWERTRTCARGISEARCCPRQQTRAAAHSPLPTPSNHFFSCACLPLASSLFGGAPQSATAATSRTLASMARRPPSLRRSCAS